VTKWIPNHPGSDVAIYSVAGQDVSEEFKNYHPEYVRTKLPYF
jgi:cytochrome b involved in lipid metabolism